MYPLSSAAGSRYHCLPEGEVGPEGLRELVLEQQIGDLLVSELVLLLHDVVTSLLGGGGMVLRESGFNGASERGYHEGFLGYVAVVLDPETDVLRGWALRISGVLLASRLLPAERGQCWEGDVLPPQKLAETDCVGCGLGGSHSF